MELYNTADACVSRSPRVWFEQSRNGMLGFAQVDERGLEPSASKPGSSSRPFGARLPERRGWLVFARPLSQAYTASAVQPMTSQPSRSEAASQSSPLCIVDGRNAFTWSVEKPGLA